MGRYSKLHSNYILKKKHQVTNLGNIYERDWVTIGGQHQIEKGKKPYYSDTNFLFTDNSYPTYKKKYSYGRWVAHWDYEDVRNSSDEVNVVKVNDSSDDIRDFAYYGSAVELVRSSVENIINTFPARVTLSDDGIFAPTAEGGYIQLNGYYLLYNPFNVDFTHTLTEDEKKLYNVDRFLTHSYDKYTVTGADITKYEVINRHFMTKQITNKVHFIEKRDVYEDGHVSGEVIVREYDEYYTYEFWQFFEDSEYKSAVNGGWVDTSCCGFTWLPNMMLEKVYYENGLTITYKTAEQREQQLAAAGRTDLLKSWLSKKDGIVSRDKNFPLYTVKINDSIELEAYIINNDPVLMTSTSSFVLRPKKELFEEYFDSLEGFEKQLLNLNTEPLYKNSFLTPVEGELEYKYVYRDYIWPSSMDETIGYAFIDITSESYVGYLTKLIDMAQIFDELWCDNLYRNMTHEAIKNFDWTYTREYNEGEEQDNIDGGNQIMKLLHVYGRCFDDIKRLADGIGYVTKNTYDGYTNQPDAEISDRLETMGWDITSTVPSFKDTSQGYIGINSKYVISAKTRNALPDTEKDKYELAYIDEGNANIIGASVYDSDEMPELVKKRYKKYYPEMDLSDVVITNSLINTFTKLDGSAHAKWFDAVNPNNIDTAKSDIEFMRRLLLSSGRIFNTKGTKQSIDMVMGMFGFGNDEKANVKEYELTEYYYYIDEAQLSNYEITKDNTEKLDLVEEINLYKDYPKTYDDIYSGVPLNDVFIGKKHYIVPFYSQSRAYDGDFIFESRGGWGKMKNTGEEDNDFKYTETLSYLHVINDFSGLLDLSPSSLNDGDIYYVSNLSNYSEYVNIEGTEETLSHFFVLNEDGKYNPQLPESWSNINMDSLDEADSYNIAKAKYLSSIVSSNFGNNPHVGYGVYDGGIDDEFKEYMELPFKYSIDEYLLDDTMIEKAKEIKYTLAEGQNNDKIKLLIDYEGENASGSETVNGYYINRKLFVMKNLIDNDMYKKYFMDVIVKYLMQVIPSTAILVLEDYEVTSTAEIESYGDINVSLSYSGTINARGDNTLDPATFSYSQTVTMSDGSTKEIINDSDANVEFSMSPRNTINSETGRISGVGPNNTQTQQTYQVTVKVDAHDASKTVTVTVNQEKPTVSSYDAPVVQVTYPDIPAAGGTVQKTSLTYTQRINYSNGEYEVKTNESGATIVYSGEHVSSDGSVTLDANTSTTPIDVTVIVSVTLNGVTGSATATIHQPGKIEVGHSVKNVTLSYGTIPYQGGSVRPRIDYTCVTIYSDGDTFEKQNDSRATVVYEGSEGHTSSSGVVTYSQENTETSPQTRDHVKATVTFIDSTPVDSNYVAVNQAGKPITEWPVHWIDEGV